MPVGSSRPSPKAGFPLAASHIQLLSTQKLCSTSRLQWKLPDSQSVVRVLKASDLGWIYSTLGLPPLGQSRSVNTHSAFY